MKIAFIGGGALRLLGAVEDILNRPDVFRDLNLVFMDRDIKRAETVSGLARKMPAALQTGCRMEATDSLVTALEGADFVYCYIRVGGVTALERDIRIALGYGYHGHDDFGPSAVMLTARTVPVVLDIAALMERYCPEAYFLIFSNPITLLTDAVTRYSRIKSVGICPGVNNFAWDMDSLFGIGVPSPGLSYRGGGLNHFSWITADSTYNGEPVMEFVNRKRDEISYEEAAKKCRWDLAVPMMEMYGTMFLNNGHQYHYLYHKQMTAELSAYFERTEDDALRSARQEKAMLEMAALLQQERIEDYWEHPVIKDCRSGPFCDTGVSFMEAVTKDSGAELIVTLPNRGHIAGLEEGYPVETSTQVHRSQCRPIGIDPVPDALKGLCNAIGYHQRLTVDAAVKGEKAALFKAMFSDPVMRSYEEAYPMFEELWTAAGRDI